MPDEEPSSSADYPSFLLDFLYVDVARVRSYLAQLAGGLATTTSEASEHTHAYSAEASIPIARGGRSGGQTARWETTRALGDLLVPAFEEEATAAGYLIDITGDFDSPPDWYDGVVHDRLQTGTIFRHSGPTRLLDPVHLSEMVEHFEGAAEALVRLFSGPPKKPPHGSGRATPKPSPASADVSGLKGLEKTTQPIRQLIRNLLAGGISLRVFPCGPDHPDCGFGGLLLDRSEYIEPERGAVFSRYGVAVSDWTVVGAVTRLPTRATRSSVDPTDPAAMLRASGGVNRGALEGLVLQLLDVMEGLGLTEAPAWPSISITPLAVYRTIPQPLRADSAN